MTEWEPATEAEAAMRDALRANDQELYFRILARTELFLPVPAGASTAGASAGWGTWTTAGRTHVLAFTSGAALRACLADNAGVNRPTPFSELAGNWPNLEWWLAVNPGLSIEGYLPAWFVAQLSRGDVRLPGRTFGARARMEGAEATGRTGSTGAAPTPTAPGQREAPRDAFAPPSPARPERASDPWSAARSAPAAATTSGDRAAPFRQPPPPFRRPPESSSAAPPNEEPRPDPDRRPRPAPEQEPWAAPDQEPGPAPDREIRSASDGESRPDGEARPGSDRKRWSAADLADRTHGTEDRSALLTGQTDHRPAGAPGQGHGTGSRSPLTGWYAAADRSAARSVPALEPTEVTRAQPSPAASRAPAAAPRPRIIEGALVDTPAAEPARPADPPVAQPAEPVDHGDATVPDATPDTTVLGGHGDATVPDPYAETTALDRRPDTVGLHPHGETAVLDPHPETTVPDPHAQTTVLHPHGETVVLDPAAERAAEPPLLGNRSGIGPTDDDGMADDPSDASADPAAFVPVNDVEQTLFVAAAEGSTDTFLSTLLLARVLLPVAADSAADARPGDEGFVWRTESIDGETYVVAFTSAERLAEHLPARTQTVSVKFVQLIRRWPANEWSFAVNPGTPVGAKLPGEQIVALASWAADVGLGDDAGVPEPQPVEPAPTPERPEPAASAATHDPNRPTMMQKAVAPSQVGFYLDRGYDRVSGFVQRAAELAHLRTPAALYAALGLHHAGSPFAAAADEIYLLRWPAHRPSLYRIPYGGQDEAAMRAMEGWVIERPPFRGNGFAPGEGSDVVAEFKVDSARLPHGAQLVRLTADGAEQLVAVLDCDLPVWRKVDPA